MQQIELQIRTPQGEKTFVNDDVNFGVLEECLKLEEEAGTLTDREAFQRIPEILKMLFPDITDDDIKYCGFNKVKKLLNEDIKRLTNPIEKELKN